MRKLELITTNTFYIDTTCDMKSDGLFVHSFYHHYKRVVKPDYQLNVKDYKKCIHYIRFITLHSILQGVPINLGNLGKIMIKPFTAACKYRKYLYSLKIYGGAMRNHRTTIAIDFIKPIYIHFSKNLLNRYEITRVWDFMKTKQYHKIAELSNKFENIIIK